MGKHTLEPIVQFLMKLGAKPIYNISRLDSFLLSGLGKAVFDKMVAFSNKRFDDNVVQKDGARGDTNVAFYEFKNEEYERSRIISLAYDYGFFRECGSWLGGHKALFGDSVLDFGCDNGILTCFMAWLMPDKHFTGIDRCARAVDNARILAEELNLANVTFLYDRDLTNHLFDTVFVSRVFQENGLVDDIGLFNKYRENVERVVQNLGMLPGFLMSHVKENGNVVNLYRGEIDVHFFGLLEAFRREGASLNVDSFKKIVVEAISNINLPEFFLAYELQKSSEETESSLNEKFLKLSLQDGLDITLSQYRKRDLVSYIRHIRGGDMILGYWAKKRGLNTPVVRVAIYSHRNDDTAFWYEIINEQKQVLACIDRSELGVQSEFMEKEARKWPQVMSGVMVYKLVNHNGDIQEELMPG